jgi:DNA-binding NtrC family response regulator
MKPQVLIVEDDLAMAQMLVEGLGRRGYESKAVKDGESALAALSETDFQAVVTDINMKGMDGLSLCERILTSEPGLPVLVITGFGSMETAIKAIRAGAWDFLTKPFELEALAIALSRAVQHKQLREEVKRLREEVGAKRNVSALVGQSRPMLDLVSLAQRVADTESAVLVTGEGGTGKKTVARMLHDGSRRKNGPFVTVHCGTSTSPLHLEAELFGAAKRPGAFSRAHGGTLVLEEVGELPAELQIRVVRALLDRRVRPAGSEQDVPFDTRVVSTSSRDLQAEVDEKRFRDDLFSRLCIVNLHLPALRLRGNDVLLLAQHFVKTFAERSHKKVDGLATACAQKLLAYGWPGNVRELQNVIERAVALARHEQLTADDLPEKVVHPQTGHHAAGADESLLVPMDQVERLHILRVLRAVGGHRTQAAKILGLDRKTLYRKLESYDPAEVEQALKDAPPAQRGAPAN